MCIRDRYMGFLPPKDSKSLLIDHISSASSPNKLFVTQDKIDEAFDSFEYNPEFTKWSESMQQESRWFKIRKLLRLRDCIIFFLIFEWKCIDFLSKDSEVLSCLLLIPTLIIFVVLIIPKCFVIIALLPFLLIEDFIKEMFRKNFDIGQNLEVLSIVAAKLHDENKSR
eukprot:TRINITY_DN10899_c0_g1_i1.p1 TRINITY_DN10899_c0_g1~~TRINITY_DN10899_c0_g1_i1.p1  ORF type:complete len:188 (+),score=25.85 TRINITY_DN10899_c0_g1_i1:62-565(+)